VEAALNRGRTLAAQIASELRNKRLDFIDKLLLAQLLASAAPFPASFGQRGPYAAIVPRRAACRVVRAERALEKAKLIASRAGWVASCMVATARGRSLCSVRNVAGRVGTDALCDVSNRDSA
jgi:hypothetical protein